jgi:peptidoglycan-associated lipoprotein
MNSLRLQFSDMRHRNPVYDDDQMGSYVLRTPEKVIWFEAYVGQNREETYYLTVVEKQALEVKAGLLPAEEMKRELDAKGHVALYINFDFDKSDIRPGDAKILDENARWLGANPRQIVLIEGHCDERGTNEYNIALGDRRARATMNYLVSRGVQASRMTTLSYGEERPVCTQKDESCWSQNRRAQFLTKAGE